MGFRSVIIVEDLVAWWDDQFKAKYARFMNFPGDGHVSSKHEFKMFEGTEFAEDVQAAMRRTGCDLHRPLEIACFHECGGVTKIQVTPDSIRFLQPYDWRDVECITHEYCYRCSEPK